MTAAVTVPKATITHLRAHLREVQAKSRVKANPKQWEIIYVSNSEDR